MFRYIFSFFLLFFVIGCQYIIYPQSKEEQLYHMLISLDKNVSKSEAKRLSRDIISFAIKLKYKYQPVIEPHFNNFLVNIGFKQYGLCYEWSDALYLHFIKQHYEGFRFHLIVSNQGEYWSEHNAFVITTKDKSILDGIVIDLWRYPDDIYMDFIKKDTSYKWRWRNQRENIR